MPPAKRSLNKGGPSDYPPPVLQALKAGDFTPTFTYEAFVRFQDIDAAGIVFFARILEYFHDAFLAFVTQEGISLAADLRNGEVLAPLGHAEADFFKPLMFGDSFCVDVVARRVADSQIRLGYRLRKAETLCAVGVTDHVFVNRATMKRQTVPEDWATAFAKLPSL